MLVVFIAVFVILVVALHSLHFDVNSHPSVSYCRLFTPIYTFSPAHCRGIRGTLILTFPVPSFIVSPRALLF